MTQVTAYLKGGFVRCYLKALSGAALAFGLSHALQAIAMSVFRYGSAYPRFDALLSLSLFSLIESLIFFVLAMVAAFLPARVADRFISPPTGKMTSIYGWLGALAGLTYLPLCAGVSVSVLPSMDDPAYFQRCIEYLLPMMLAGVTGGYLFGRFRALTSEIR